MDVRNHASKAENCQPRPLLITQADGQQIQILYLQVLTQMQRLY